MFAEDINQQLAEGQKQIESLWASSHQKEFKPSVQVKATSDPINPSPKQKKLKNSVAAEVRQRFEERKAESNNPYPEFNSNLGFL